MIRAVFLDIGETLIDETRHWAAWADWLRIPHLTFFGALGAAIERGEHHRAVLDGFRPGIDVHAELEKMRMAGREPDARQEDLYPDAVPCLRALRDRGYRIGLAGNQPASIEPILARMGLPVDVIASSARWGVAKPSSAFFQRIVQAARVPAGEIAYVGDRLDNDVLPARQAGMLAVFLRRGPWGFVHARRTEIAQAHLRLDSLEELPAALETAGAKAGDA